MSRQLSLEEVHNGQALLLELLQEVSEEEGTLSGGTKIATPSNELLRLRESKVILRNPRNHLTRLTNKLFDTAGIELTEIYKHQIGDQFDFYYMTLTVSLQSAPGIPFRQLHFSLDFGPKGVDEPIIQTMFPKGEWKEILSWGGGLSLALNGNLDWGAEVSNIPPMFDIASLPGHIRANIASNGKLNAFITVPDFSFKLGRVDIAVMGEGGSDCYWRVEQPRLQEVQDIQFGVVFKVPKRTSSIKLTACAAAEPSSIWIADHTRNVFERLSNKLQSLLRHIHTGGDGGEHFYIPDSEIWTITLPH